MNKEEAAAIHSVSTPAEPSYEHAIKEDYDVSDTPPAEAADDLSNCCPYHAQGGFPYSPCRLPDLEAETCTHGIPMPEPCAKCQREAGTEAAGAPERVWLHNSLGYWFSVADDCVEEGDVQYISAAAHEKQVSRLREALRGTSRYTRSDGPCWCPHGADDQGGHLSFCGTARNALNSEGKEQG